MSEQLMTPAEIERAVKDACAKVSAWQHDGLSAAEEIRALPPMFGDVPAYSVANDFRAWDAVHMKTGNVYRVVGEAIDATNAHSSRPMVIYQRDGKTYVRCAEEFIEKFKAISAAPTAGQAAAKDAQDAARLNFLSRPGIEIGSESDEGEFWHVVYEVVGSVNDREWVELGRGSTLRSAIDAAMAAAPEVK